MSVLGDINDVKSEMVQLWLQRVEAHRAQNEALDIIKQDKDLESIRHSTMKQDSETHKK